MHPLQCHVPSGSAMCPVAVPCAQWQCHVPSGSAMCPVAVPCAQWQCHVPSGSVPSGSAMCPVAVPCARHNKQEDRSWVARATLSLRTRAMTQGNDSNITSPKVYGNPQEARPCSTSTCAGDCPATTHRTQVPPRPQGTKMSGNPQDARTRLASMYSAQARAWEMQFGWVAPANATVRALCVH